ncbi:PHP domain-containing protein [Streptomyces rubiginosohelvolus]|uniref:PHP domain-containing protein n=1 Tax=Streptomyces rubiginosohelvolus TaxID=67362 RepID=UPI0036E59C33
MRSAANFDARLSQLEHSLARCGGQSQLASERGIGALALALTDRDMVTGTVRFAKAATAAGVKPLFGVDLGIAPVGQAPSPTPAQPEPGRTIPDGTAGGRLHPWSDLQPAGTRSADLTRFGHRSPGSPGQALLTLRQLDPRARTSA